MKDLKALFESQVLNEETKTVIQEAFDAVVEAKKVELEADYAQKLEESKTEMVKATVELVEEAVAEELEAIAEEVKHARTLEVQYAEKLQNFKESYAEKQEETAKLYVAEAVQTELDELKEDIEMAKKHEFAMQMFESFKDTYERLFGASKDEVSVFDRLAEATQELDQLRREKKMSELLECVSGKKREIAETILEGVKTEDLEARFETIRGVLLAESVEEDGDVITESASNEEKDVKGNIVLENVEQETSNADKTDARFQKLQRSLKLAQTR